MNTKNKKTCKSSLCCRATASLNKATDKELEKPDRSLGELLDEKENEGDNVCDDSGDRD